MRERSDPVPGSRPSATRSSTGSSTLQVPKRGEQRSRACPTAAGQAADPVAQRRAPSSISRRVGDVCRVAPAAARGRGQQQVEEAVVLEAGRRVGVPDGVVQAGGALERRRRGRRTRCRIAASSAAVGNRPRPRRRRCGSSPGSRGAGEDVEHLVPRRGRGAARRAAGTVRGRATCVEHARRAAAASPSATTGISTAASRSRGSSARRGATRAGQVDRPSTISETVERRRRRPGVARSSSSRPAGHDERPDQRPRRCRGVARCAGTAPAIGGVAGREQRRVVERARRRARSSSPTVPAADQHQAYLPSSRARCRPRRGRSGRKVSTMTASSSKYSAPRDALDRAGLRAVAVPAGVQGDRALADAGALAGLVVAVDVEHDLVGVDVGVVVGHRDRQRVVVDLARHEVADHEVVALEDLVHRRRLVDAAGDRLEVGDVEGVGVEAAVPADDVERVLRDDVDRAGQAAGPVPRCLT